MSTTLATPGNTFVPGQFMIRKARLLSVCPVRQEATLRHGPVNTSIAFTTYILEAAPKDGHVILEVEDSQEWMMRWEQREMGAAPVSALSIANALVERWATQTIGSGRGGKLGIAVVDEARPIEDQVKELRLLQTKLFNDLTEDGQTMFNRQEFRNISDLHRAAARWLGVSVPWLVELRQQVGMKKCVNCAEEIIATALGCKHCGTNLPKWYMEFGIPADDDDVVKAFIAKIAAKSEALRVGESRQQPIAAPLKPTSPKN